MARLNRVTGETNSITDVTGIHVGNYSDRQILSGTTVIIPEERAKAGVDIRGGAPGTREVALLDPVNLVQEVDAVTLSGGSSYGLATATGVMEYLEEQGRGYKTRKGEAVYRDKGYFGVEPRGWDATMRRGVRVILSASGIG